MDCSTAFNESLEVSASPEKVVPEPIKGYKKVAQDTMKRQSAKLSRYRKTFRVIYTVLLIFIHRGYLDRSNRSFGCRLPLSPFSSKPDSSERRNTQQFPLTKSTIPATQMCR